MANIKYIKALKKIHGANRLGQKFSKCVRIPDWPTLNRTRKENIRKVKLSPGQVAQSVRIIPAHTKTTNGCINGGVTN